MRLEGIMVIYVAVQYDADGKMLYFEMTWEIHSALGAVAGNVEFLCRAF